MPSRQARMADTALASHRAGRSGSRSRSQASNPLTRTAASLLITHAANRRAMDGVLPGGKIPFKPRAREQGFNSVLSTTHRQNFIVPPRRHRSFPLAEV